MPDIKTDNVEALPLNHLPQLRDEISELMNGDAMPPEFVEYLIETANTFDQLADLSPDPVMMRRLAQQIRKALDYFRFIEGQES